MNATAHRLRLVVAASAAALLLAGLPAAPARGANHAVTIADFAFSPATLTITAGDTVTWTNEDAMIHTATSVDGAFDSGDLDQGDDYSLTFTTPGTYDYLCTPHPSMTGRIVVVAATNPAPSAAPSGALPNVAVQVETGSRPIRLLGSILLGLGATGTALVIRRRSGSRR
jgi:amicyanin